MLLAYEVVVLLHVNQLPVLVLVLLLDVPLELDVGAPPKLLLEHVGDALGTVGFEAVAATGHVKMSVYEYTVYGNLIQQLCVEDPILHYSDLATPLFLFLLPFFQEGCFDEAGLCIVRIHERLDQMVIHFYYGLRFRNEVAQKRALLLARLSELERQPG